MLSNIRSYFYNLKRFQAPLEKYLFPVVLLLYPLIGINQGLNIADTTYGLSNYEYFGSIDPMWAISTFLSNVAGSAIMKLPGAGNMVGMSFYCSLIIGITAIIPYYMLQRWMPGWMIFIGEFIAESLCWCPRVILYNYLTYLFFTLGTLFLLVGMFEWEKQNRYLLLAGIFLGLNVMVRFPNVVEAGMILVLWFFEIITGGKFIEALKKTLVCVGGYLIGLVLPFVFISVKYGPLAYFDMIGSLFGMTSGASDYTAGGMLSSIISAYLTTGKDMIIMVPCIVAGMVMFGVLPEKYLLIKKLLYVAGLFVLVRFYFADGVFTRNYHYYDSVFQAAMMFVIIGIILSVVGSSGVLNGSKEEQTLALAVLLIMLITPLGSNNYTYPVINNLFVVAPVTLWFFRRMMQRLGEKQTNFPWQGMVTMVIAVVLVQGAIFHYRFAFGDGMEGQIRDARCSIPKVKSMVTTDYNADSLDELYDTLFENELLGDKVILFGGIPGLSYIYDLEPAIDTVWPDLDSYSVEKFDDQLQKLSVSSDDAPTVIVGKEMAEYANIEAKYDILMDYINYQDYNKVFESERFIVFAQGGTRSEE